MRISEVLRFKPNNPENIKKISNIGALTFGRGITKKNETITPHYEINTCLTNFETMPIINSAVNQLINFIIPNKDIKISSKDAKSVEFLEKWHKERYGFLEEVKNILTTNIVCGNGVVENFYNQMKDGIRVYDNMFSINDVSRIYINPDDVDGPTAYIFELPIGIKNFIYMGVNQTPQFYNVKYIKNYTFIFKRVYGFPIPGWKISHYKSGWSRDNLYGRSQLTSAIDAVNIFKEIMSSWDTIAKTRQVDQKIISLADPESSMQTYDDEQLQDIEEKLNNSDNSYNIIGLPLKMLQTDITVSQGFNLMEGAVEVLRRQIIMSLLPQHLTPWSDSGTTQGSEASMPPFMLRLKAKQNEYIAFLNDCILTELRKTYTWLADDVSYVFDEPKIMTDDYYSTFMSSLIDSQIIDAKQAKDYLLKMGILDSDVFNSESSVDTKDVEEPQNEEDEEAQDEQQPRQYEKMSYKGMLEAVKEADISFDAFKRRLNERYKKKPFSTEGWVQVNSKEIGGHKIRLVDTNKEMYLLFDGLTLIENYNKDAIQDGKQIKSLFDSYVEKVKKSFEELKDEETPEDVMFDTLQKEVEAEYKTRLDKFFKSVHKFDRKTEGFLSDKILPSLTNTFKGFNSIINKSVSNIMKKFNVNIIKDDGTDGAINKKNEDTLKAKNDLMIKNLQKSLQTVKDNNLQIIQTKLSQGIAAGQSMSDIKSDIEKETNYEKGVSYKIDRAIQTGGRNATRIIRLKKLQSQGFDEVLFITRDDKKVRDKHKHLNNKVFPIEKVLGWYTKNTIPGTYWNCRCTFTGY